MQARVVLAAIAAGALFLIGSCTSNQTQNNNNGGDDCSQGQLKCANGCTNPLADNLNCGACNNACPTGTACANGTCMCQGAALQCGGRCIDRLTDITNCGQCNNNCGSNAFCNGGNCACLPGHQVCGTGPAAHCVNGATDVMNCGMCGVVCPTTAPYCQAGACSATCTLTVCQTACVDTMTDPANCGSCGRPCPQGQTCNGGVCGCAGGQQSCNGVCTDVMTSTANCGACGRPCAAGQACNGGVCSCAPPQILCGGVCTDPSNPACGSGGSGGTAGTGGSGVGGTGGASAGSGPGGQGGTGGSGMGGSGMGGSGGSSSRPTGCPAGPGVLSDFEEGPPAVLVPAEGRDGWWYVFGQTGGMQTPPNVTGGPITATLLPTAEGMCNRYALHSTASGKPQYSGFGATMHPTGTAANAKGAVSFANYTGINFKIRTGSGTHPGVFFEILTRENQPGPNCSTCGANSDLGGTATNNAIDAYNTRGRRLPTINQASGTMSSQDITIPFGTLAPRYLPSGTGCPANVLCEAPPFNPASVLGIQFSVYDQFGTTGGYDLWIDDVKLTTGDAGLPTLPQTAGAMHPFPRDAAIPNCTKPANALGKYLIEAYQTWKQTFVDPNPGPGLTAAGTYRVKRPEASNDTVSEGIGYGMLIAVYMNDKNLFDGLWAFWKQHPASGAGMLMNWQLNSGGGVIGAGSATDADEDAAFALIMASRQWGGGTYASDANTMINNLYQYEVASGGVLKPGNSFGGSDLTNPSYFAPAYYRVFDTFESTNHDWTAVINSTYTYLNSIKGTYGLVPAWCSGSCGSPGGGGYQDADKYQYDSHRTPWRIGLDACWNNESRAKTYVALTSTFFAGQSDGEGLGALADMYYTSGGKFGTKANSMSLIGTAAVGAMASAGGTTAHKAFLDRGYRFIVDAMYTPDPMTRMTAYTYYNATVGLLTALTMSGNFNSW